jgi:hypothetical protein
MDNITKIETENTGGGCMVDILTLWNGQVIVVNDECIGVYSSKDDFYNSVVNDDESKLLCECWYRLPKPKPEPVFSAYWGIGYGEPRCESLPLSWFVTERGYRIEDITRLHDVELGGKVDLSDLSGDHFVVRIK